MSRPATVYSSVRSAVTNFVTTPKLLKLVHKTPLGGRAVVAVVETPPSGDVKRSDTLLVKEFTVVPVGMGAESSLRLANEMTYYEAPEATDFVHVGLRISSVLKGIVGSLPASGDTATVVDALNDRGDPCQLRMLLLHCDETIEMQQDTLARYAHNVEFRALARVKRYTLNTTLAILRSQGL